MLPITFQIASASKMNIFEPEELVWEARLKADLIREMHRKLSNHPFLDQITWERLEKEAEDEFDLRFKEQQSIKMYFITGAKKK